jgi:hypothetical protein
MSRADELGERHGPDQTGRQRLDARASGRSTGMNRRECLKQMGLAGGMLLFGRPRARLFAQDAPLRQFGALRAEADRIGKPTWRPMLHYLAQLHERGVKPAREPFKHPWEEIGPGYQRRAFGHWDIVHEILDVMPAQPEHAMDQIDNDLVSQQEDGFLPGSIYLNPTDVTFSKIQGHPPVWPVAVDDYSKLFKKPAIPEKCFNPLLKQINWFETNRKADGEGAFYTDILTQKWESGVDEGVRFIGVQSGKRACVDATSHLYQMYDLASQWAQRLGKPTSDLEKRANELRDFIQNRLFVEETGFFHDSWAVDEPGQRVIAFEGLWPVIVGAATPEQARRVVEKSVLDENRFFCPHPISTVGVKEKTFELRMWRGPAWNSMTYWTARGCLRYGFKDAAKRVLERALDDSAAQFDRTGTIWEFYHPFNGPPEELRRKMSSGVWTHPCRDYLGHNPLFAMTRLWEQGPR